MSDVALTPATASDGGEPTRIPGAAPARPVYRADLDGLRGLAILLVVVFHVWVGRVSGGVDAFLVLSGFFFVGSLVRAGGNGSLRVRAVAARTARRLLPALVTVLAGVVVATVVFLPAARRGVISEQTLAALGYVQNWWLALQAQDYAAAGAEVSPLQHLWSMAVQGQFFVLATLAVALIAVVLGPDRRHRLPQVGAVVLGILAATSFAWAMWRNSVDPSFTYYDSVARMWEMLAGALLGLGAARVRLPAPVRTALGWAGLVALGACGLVVNGGQAFPGPAALLPVLATVAVVVSVPAGRDVPVGSDGSLLTRLLASRPATELGARAYSLYLWHWPILIFAIAVTDRPEAGRWGGAAVIAASLLLAEITYRFVEQPLRRPRPKPVRHEPAADEPRSSLPWLTGWVAAAMAVVLVVGAPTAWLVNLQGREAAFLADLAPDLQNYPGALALTSDAAVPDEPARPELTDLQFTFPASTSDGCVVGYETAEVTTCVYGDPDADRTVALVGGSHAEHWLTALNVLGLEHNFKVVTYLKVACPLTGGPTEPMLRGAVYPECAQWEDAVFAQLATDRPDQVFLTATRPRSGGDGDGRDINDTAGWGDEVPESYVDTWRELNAAGLPVLAVRDTPWLTEPTEQCLAAAAVVECSNDRDVVLDEVNPAAAYADEFPDVTFLDMSDTVCGPARCEAVTGNLVVYRDGHHITNSYALTMAPALGGQIKSATGWW